MNRDLLTFNAEMKRRRRSRCESERVCEGSCRLVDIVFKWGFTRVNSSVFSWWSRWAEEKEIIRTVLHCQVGDKAIDHLSTLLVGKTTLFHGMIAVNERTAKESSKLFIPEKREKKIRRQSKQKQSRKLGNQAINDILTDRWAGARLNIHFQLGRYVSTDVLT